MSIRIKVLAFISLTLVVLIIVLYAFSQVILLRGYENLEQDAVERNVQVVLKAVEDKILFFHNTGMDWAHWDDTYAYMQGQDDTYIETNILNSVFEYYDLDFMLFVNPAGEIIYSQGYDSILQEQIPLTESFQQFIGQNELLTHPRDKNASILPDGISGIVQLPEMNIIVAATSILPSNLKGEPAGVLIWGHYLDDEFVNQLASQTQLTLSISRITQESVEGFNDATSSVMLQAVNNEVITGSTFLKEISGTPTLLLKIEMPRDIYHQGQESIFYFLFSLILVGIILTGVIALILEKGVLSRIAYLSHHVSQIRMTRDMSSRVKVLGNDELTKLSADINMMLDTLQSQEKIKLAHDKAVEAARIKAEILANVSHDARTPLTVILMRSEMLMKGMYGSLTPKQYEILQSITLNSYQLLGFVNNMLEGAQLESGHLKLEQGEFEPAKLLEMIKLTLQPLAAVKNLRLETELTLDMPPVLCGDEKRLGRILTNLVSNAIKFTEHGAVEVKIYQLDADHWGFDVKDSGVGIPPEHQQQIFAPFWQVDGSTTRFANSGVGLGLSIVHQLSELMGGSVTVNSTVNQGSVFRVILPIRLPAKEIQYGG